jgi:hypothetical protein
MPGAFASDQWHAQSLRVDARSEIVGGVWGPSGAIRALARRPKA